MRYSVARYTKPGQTLHIKPDFNPEEVAHD